MKTQKLNLRQSNKSKLLNLIIAFAVLSILSLTSCKSDENNQEQQHEPDGVALKQHIMNNRQDALQTFNEDACTGCVITVTGTQGTKITFPANSLGLNGTPVTGNVSIELIEIYGKSSMVMQNRSSKGEKTNGDEEALNSAGEYFINAKQNDTQLDLLLPITIESKNAANIGQMNIFKAGNNLEDEGIWQEVDADEDQEPDIATVLQREDPITHEIYEVFSFPMQQFGWTNLDRWYSYTGQLTDLFVDVPDGFNETNCMVYLSYDGETGLADMDKWDTSQQMFTEHFGRIPVGQQVHFIMLAEIDGVINYAIQSATIVYGHIEVITGLQPISDADLTTLLENLP